MKNSTINRTRLENKDLQLVFCQEHDQNKPKEVQKQEQIALALGYRVTASV